MHSMCGKETRKSRSIVKRQAIFETKTYSEKTDDGFVTYSMYRILPEALEYLLDYDQEEIVDATTAIIASPRNASNDKSLSFCMITYRY